MPRTMSARGSGFAELQKRAAHLLNTLRREIRSKENDLARLKGEESRLSALAGTQMMGGRRQAGPRLGGARRLNWGTVLEQMPMQFRAGDVRKVRGLKDKRPSEVFAAITRWIEAGNVKRKERGVYERVQPRRRRKAA